MPSSSDQLVLFVCVENTFRRIISEAIFNTYAPKGWHAESTGVQPSEAINLVAIELLREIGIEMGSKKPRSVTPELVAGATRIVTFGCLDRCPSVLKKNRRIGLSPGARPGRTAL